MTDAQKAQIQADAERAARMGWTPNQMCPHPFASEQGKLWVAAYWAVRNQMPDRIVRALSVTKAEPDQKPAVDRRAH